MGDLDKYGIKIVWIKFKIIINIYNDNDIYKYY